MILRGTVRWVNQIQIAFRRDLLEALAGQWRLMMFRTVLTLLLGLAMLIWSPAGPWPLATAFAIYALLNGAATLLMAAVSRRELGFAGLALEGTTGLLVGVVALVPAVASSALAVPFAVWALGAGIGAVWTAAALRKETRGEWPLPFAGLLSLLVAALLLLQLDASAATLSRMLGWYALLAGANHATLAFHMRQLAEETNARVRSRS